VHAWIVNIAIGDDGNTASIAIMKRNRRSSDNYARFLVECAPLDALSLWEPIASTIPKHPKEVSEVFEWVILTEDSTQRRETFWALWKGTAQGFLNVPDFGETTSW